MNRLQMLRKIGELEQVRISVKQSVLLPIRPNVIGSA
jgi:hypothetical protein